MNAHPTITISWDYVVELRDDGKQSALQETEVIVMPPVSNGGNDSAAPASVPEKDPQL